jgi:ABC-type nickel/cobalt efflux system permease component RcnA
MSQSGKWSYKKTVLVTALCGFAHVISSVVLAAFVIGLGLTVVNLELIESVRSTLAGWLLISFGLVYMIWGFRRNFKYKEHVHTHRHGDDEIHNHKHIHIGNHSHLHIESEAISVTPWILFIIFILGPCEPLIPLIMYPALNNDMTGTILVISVFTLTTLITMIGIIVISFYGLDRLPVKKLERHMPAIAGFTIFLCGFAIQFLGL